MALYALGDFHLSFQTDKPMDVMGKVWVNHTEKIKKNCQLLIQEEDTLVITGDHSWGKKLDQCREDLAFISSLPGRKILLRGNHDMFWEVKKTEKLNREYEGKLSFLQNNFYTYGEYALVGTKGYTFEGPFYVDQAGNIAGYDAPKKEHADKLVEREMQRLQDSFSKAWNAGYRKFIMFLHYPPTNIMEKESPFTWIAEKYHVEHVVYSHCHGESRFFDSIQGEFHGVHYHLVSGDYLNFVPEKIL